MRLLFLLRKFGLLTTLIFPLITFAQSGAKLNFPISGLFMVEPNETNPSNRYNILEFKEDIYYLKMDEKELFSFKATGLENGLYSIQQLTYGDNVLNDKSDGPTPFKLKIEKQTMTTYRVSFVYRNHTDFIHIIQK